MQRRRFLKMTGLGLGAMVNPAWATVAGTRPPLSRPIPSTGEQVPAIGMGTWITFNIGNDKAALAQRTEVLKTFMDLGGGIVDSSPMYGSAEAVLGRILERLGTQPRLFSATKVWTSSGDDGPQEIETSRRLWGLPGFDLLQVHNLLAWERHLETLFAMKEAGRLRYVGITTSHGRRHRDLLRVMRDWPLDFVQATYNIVDRDVEDEILPLAASRGIAFIANRPFRRGELVARLEQRPLPDMADEIGCSHWPGFLLKFIVSHPAVTCAIPATSRVDHMIENMSAMHGPQPDAAMRERMIQAVRA